MSKYLREDETSLRHKRYKNMLAVGALRAQRDLLLNRLIAERKKNEQLQSTMKVKRKSKI